MIGVLIITSVKAVFSLKALIFSIIYICAVSHFVVSHCVVSHYVDSHLVITIITLLWHTYGNHNAFGLK